MQIAELRYARNRRKMDVAARLIDFEARTGTIRELTGMTDARIRSLSKECGVDGHTGSRLRHRGASPHRVSIVLGNARTRNEAATLLSICKLMGLMEEPHSIDGPVRIARAERLCDAFWTFRYLMPQATIGFEHMLLLLAEAERDEEMAILACSDCKATLVVDSLTLYSDRCPHCTVQEAPASDRGTLSRLHCVAEEHPG